MKGVGGVETPATVETPKEDGRKSNSRTWALVLLSLLAMGSWVLDFHEGPPPFQGRAFSSAHSVRLVPLGVVAGSLVSIGISCITAVSLVNFPLANLTMVLAASGEGRQAMMVIRKAEMIRTENIFFIVYLLLKV